MFDNKSLECYCNIVKTLSAVIKENPKSVAFTISARECHEMIKVIVDGRNLKHNIVHTDPGVTFTLGRPKTLFDNYREVVLSNADFQISWVNSESLTVLIAKLYAQGLSDDDVFKAAIAIEEVVRAYNFYNQKLLEANGVNVEITIPEDDISEGHTHASVKPMKGETNV